MSNAQIWEKHPTKPNTLRKITTHEEYEHISWWELPERMGYPIKPKPTEKECYAKYFKSFRKQPVTCTVVMLLVILSFFAFQALPAFIYFSIEKAKEMYGIQSWFHQIVWWGHTPFALIGAFIFFFKWEYWIWANFSPVMIGGKEEYNFICPFLTYCCGCQTPIHQLPEWLQVRLQEKKRKALEFPEQTAPSSPSSNL